MDESSSNSVPLQLQLLGWWELRKGDRRVFLGRREQRVIALLALRGRRPRLDVAATLWPDTTEARALASLRAAVLLTRRLASGAVLAPCRSTIGLDPSVQVDVDDVLEAAQGCRTRGGRADVDLNDQLRCLGRDELLPGWYEDWLLFERERLEQIRLAALESVARTALAQGQYDVAVVAATRAIMIEPLRETPHLLLVRAHLASGNLASAVGEFHAYRGRLQRELGIGPSPRMVDLMRSLDD